MCYIFFVRFSFTFLMISWFVAQRNDNFALTLYYFKSLTLKFVNKESVKL